MGGIEKRLGKVVRKLREEKGLTQDAFAHKAGIARSYYGQIERGESEVSLQMAEVVAKTLGLKLSELFSLLEKEEE